MAEIRFKNLPKLLKDIQEKGWRIDSFLFEYNGVKTIAIITLYENDDKKTSKYAVAKIEFVMRKDTTKSINGYIDFYEVHFKDYYEFIRFFNINVTGERRDLFIDFAEYFSKKIPDRKIVQKNDEIERVVLARRTDPNDPDAIYCKEVRRNGRFSDGTPHHRSPENSNKAELLRENLYLKYKEELNYSFYFSTKPEDERTDEEIMIAVAKRDK